MAVIKKKVAERIPVRRGIQIRIFSDVNGLEENLEERINAFLKSFGTRDRFISLAVSESQATDGFSRTAYVTYDHMFYEDE